jgi:hypothetical protein
LDAPAQPSKRRASYQSVWLKGGYIAFFNWILTVLIAILSISLFNSPLNSKRGLNVNDELCVQSESLVTLVQEY